MSCFVNNWLSESWNLLESLMNKLMQPGWNLRKPDEQPDETLWTPDKTIWKSWWRTDENLVSAIAQDETNLMKNWWKPDGDWWNWWNLMEIDEYLTSTVEPHTKTWWKMNETLAAPGKAGLRTWQTNWWKTGRKHHDETSWQQESMMTAETWRAT